MENLGGLNTYITAQRRACFRTKHLFSSVSVKVNVAGDEMCSMKSLDLLLRQAPERHRLKPGALFKTAQCCEILCVIQC